jgi:hypothetical protein
MDAKSIAESLLLLVIAGTSAMLVPDLMRYIKLRPAKYGRRTTDS